MRSHVSALPPRTKIADQRKEALDHLARVDEQSACDVLNMAHYPMSHVQNDWQGLIEAFDANVVCPSNERTHSDTSAVFATHRDVSRLLPTRL